MISEEQIPLIAEKKQSSRDLRSGIVFSWSHVCVSVLEKQKFINWIRRKPPEPECLLLDNVSGIALPGQVLAIMGASGVGKTTLLKALSGLYDISATTVTGDFFLNGHVAPQVQRLNNSVIGHVEQHEVFVETMTTEEYLIFQAMLRMHRSMKDEERRNRVYTAMAVVSLQRNAKTLINRLSGGERKRLAFATVFLTDPPIVLIDEPTSGLDSYLAKMLMRTIRTMAVEYHRTIIIALHQPTSVMFDAIDSLCLIVHGGRQAFFGDKSKALTFFASECRLSASSLDGYIEQLAETPDVAKETAHRGTLSANCFAQSNHLETLLKRISTLYEQPLTKINGKNVEEWRSGFGRELKWVAWRSFIFHRRNLMKLFKPLCRLIVSAILFGMIFFHLHPHKEAFVHNLKALSNFMLLLLFGSNMSVIIISVTLERPLVIREYKRHTYSLTSYYIVRFFANTCYSIASSCLYMMFIVLLVDVRHGATVIGIVTLATLTAAAWASLIGTLAPTPTAGILIIQPFQIAVNQFSGYYIRLHSVPAFIRWFKYLSYFYYCYSLLLINQFNNLPCAQYSSIFFASDKPHNDSVCLATGQDVLNCYEVNPKEYDFNVGMSFVSIFALHLIAFIVTVIRIRRAVLKSH